MHTAKPQMHECPECGRSFRHKGNLIRHMALHDPDSTVQEKAIALKIGRQKKIQIIDGQQVEVYTGGHDAVDEDGELLYNEADFEDEEEEDLVTGTPHEAAANAAMEAYKAQHQGDSKAGIVAGTSSSSNEMVSVEGQDGQHYVVLEVIQYPDGTEGTVATPATAADKGAVLASVAPAVPMEVGESSMAGLAPAPPPKVQAKVEAAESKEMVTKKDKARCFGFDDDVS